jgi:hypothetical protein
METTHSWQYDGFWRRVICMSKSGTLQAASRAGEKKSMKVGQHIDR